MSGFFKPHSPVIKGKKAPRLPKSVLRPVTETVRLIQTLQSLVGGDDAAVRECLEKPNSAFGGQKPITLIMVGQTDRLWEMAYRIRRGEFAWTQGD